MRYYPRILGLSAFLTFSTSDMEIQRSIAELCNTLLVDPKRIFTATMEELRADGYHAAQVEAKVAEPDYISFDEDDQTSAPLFCCRLKGMIYSKSFYAT